LIVILISIDQFRWHWFARTEYLPRLGSHLPKALTNQSPIAMKPDRTRSQERILQLLQQLDRAISAQDIYAELRTRDRAVGLATVYRALEGLKLEGSVQGRTLPTGESLYSCVQADRHHLTCLHCQESIPIDECPVEQLETKLEALHQFKIYYHTLEFFGVCLTCVATAPDNGDDPVIHQHHTHDRSKQGTA
jgi:Fur family transcriptional regulator, ferric uptake regulator